MLAVSYELPKHCKFSCFLGVKSTQKLKTIPNYLPEHPAKHLLAAEAGGSLATAASDLASEENLLSWSVGNEGMRDPIGSLKGYNVGGDFGNEVPCIIP